MPNKAEVHTETVEQFVAEHIMGFERGGCQGAYGFGDSNGDCGYYCDWCGATRKYSDETVPCPNYPFPDFTLIDLMRKLGENGIPITVRYDTLRKENHFTIIGPEGRIADTDEPFERLCDYLYMRYSGVRIDAA